MLKSTITAGLPLRSLVRSASPVLIVTLKSGSLSPTFTVPDFDWLSSLSFIHAAGKSINRQAARNFMAFGIVIFMLWCIFIEVCC